MKVCKFIMEVVVLSASNAAFVTCVKPLARATLLAIFYTQHRHIKTLLDDEGDRRSK